MQIKMPTTRIIKLLVCYNLEIILYVVYESGNEWHCMYEDSCVTWLNNGYVKDMLASRVVLDMSYKSKAHNKDFTTICKS